MKSIYLLAVLVIAMAIQSVAHAQETPLTYDRIDLSVSETREVENDILVAVLYAQKEGSRAAQLADSVNRSIQWAIDIAKNTRGIKVQTLDYHTRPTYNKQALTGWRVRQSIRLESKDSAVLSELIGSLQEQLAIQSVGYSISPEKRQETENSLIEDAIGQFNERARVVASRLGRREYRLVRMSVDTGSRPAPVYAAREMLMKADSAPSPPAMEPGTGTVQVQIRGTIELRIDQ